MAANTSFQGGRSSNSGGRGNAQVGRRGRSGAMRQFGGGYNIHNKPQVVEEPNEELRQCITSSNKKLHIHDLTFSNQDLLINNDGFPHLRDGDIVQIFQPSAPERKFTLTVKWLSSVTDKTNTRLQVSLLKSVAEVFKLSSFCEIQIIGPIDPLSDPGLFNEISFVELHFKDQFVSRADLWRFTNEIISNVPVYKNKLINLVGMKAKVEELKIFNHDKQSINNNHHHHNQSNQIDIESGVITNKTKVIFRSRSTRIFWLVEMSIEMWQPHDTSSGELYFDKFINGFVRPVLQRWKDDETQHSVSIIFFTRTFINNQSNTNININSSSTNHPFSSNNHQFKSKSLSDFSQIYHQNDQSSCRQMSNNMDCTLQKDIHGRLYRDYYKMVFENQDLTNLDQSIIHKLKEEFISFPRQVGVFDMKSMNQGMNNVPVNDKGLNNNSFNNNSNNSGNNIPCSAPHGNVLEAINLTLNILDKHFMDRDLTRTGNSIVMITPSPGIFRINNILSKITKQRMMDNGIGMDMISLSSPPLHSVPLFIHSNKKTNVGGNGLYSGANTHLNGNGHGTAGNDKYEMPYWMNLSYLSRKYLVGRQDDDDDDDDEGSSEKSNIDNKTGISSVVNSNTSDDSVNQSSSGASSSSSSGLGLDGDIGSTSSIDPERGRFGFGGDATEFTAGLLRPPAGVKTDNGVKILYPNQVSRELPPALNVILNSTPLIDSIKTIQQQTLDDENKVDENVSNNTTKKLHPPSPPPVMGSLNSRIQKYDMKSEFCPKPIISPMIRNTKGELIAHAPIIRNQQQMSSSHHGGFALKYSHLKRDQEPSGLSSLLKKEGGGGKQSEPKISPQIKSHKTLQGAPMSPKKYPQQQHHQQSQAQQALNIGRNNRNSDESPVNSHSPSPRNHSSPHSHSPCSRSWESGVLAGSALISPQNASPSKKGSSSMGSRSYQSSYQPQRSLINKDDESSSTIAQPPSLRSSSSNIAEDDEVLSIEEQMNEFDKSYWVETVERNNVRINSFGYGTNNNNLRNVQQQHASGAPLKRDRKLSNSFNSLEGGRTSSTNSFESIPHSGSENTMYVGSEGGRLSDGKLSSTVSMVPEATVMTQASLSEQQTQNVGFTQGVQQAQGGGGLTRMKRSPNNSSERLPPEGNDSSTSNNSTLPPPPPTPYDKRLINYMSNVAGSIDSGYALYFTGGSISPDNIPINISQSQAQAPTNSRLSIHPTITTSVVNTGVVNTGANMNPPSRLMPDNRRIHSQQQQQQLQLQQLKIVGSSLQNVTNTQVGGVLGVNNAGNIGLLNINSEDLVNEFINPFKQESEKSLVHRKTHARRRWSHVFILDENEFNQKKKLGLNYKSLSTPAVLPLTTDYVPHLRELESERYSQRPDPVALPRDSISDSSYIKLVREIVMQRLACDFQLADNDEVGGDLGVNLGNVSTLGQSSSSTSHGSGRSSVHSSLNSVQRGPRITTLTMGHRIHRIEIAAPFTHVKITEYASILASKANELNIGLTQPQPHLMGAGGGGGGGNNGMGVNSALHQLSNQVKHVADESFKYRYMNWDKLSSSFQVMEQSFQQFPDSLAWNSVDQLIVTPMMHLDPYPMRARNTRYKRILFVIIPPVPTSHSQNDILIFFKSRYKLRHSSLSPLSLSRSISAPLSPTSTSSSSSPSSSSSSSSNNNILKPIISNLTPPSNDKINEKINDKVVVDPCEVFRTQLGKFETWLNSLKSSGSEVLNIKFSDFKDDIHGSGGGTCGGRSGIFRPVGKTLVTVPFTNKRPWNTYGDRSEWALVVPDNEMRAYQCYRLEVNWLLCTGYNVSELVSLLYKQCLKAGLRLAQVPQHTLSEHLSIHSFSGASWIEVKNNHTLHVVMELSLKLRYLFISDSKQSTDWNLSFPFLTNPANQMKPPLLNPPPMIGPNYRDTDSQYIQQKGIAMVRVCSGKGFAWVMNSLRISDVYLSHSAKHQLNIDLMHAFQSELSIASILYDCVIIPLAIKSKRNYKMRKEGDVSNSGMDAEACCLRNALLLWNIVEYLDLPQALKDGGTSS